MTKQAQEIIQKTISSFLDNDFALDGVDIQILSQAIEEALTTEGRLK